MCRHKHVGVDVRRFPERLADLPGIGIEDARRQRHAPRQRKRIAGKEHAFARRQQADVTGGVAGKRDDAQSAPERQFIAVANPNVHARRPVAHQPPPRRFESPAHTRHAVISMRAGDVRLVADRCVDFCAAPVLEFSRVAGVIEVAVREQNRLELAELIYRSPDAPRIAK